jgi:hypothetical protein
VAACNPVLSTQLPNVIPCSKEMSFFEADVRSANQGISHILWFVTLSRRVPCWSVSQPETLCVVLWRANFFIYFFIELGLWVSPLPPTHLLSAVRGCLLNIFAIILRVWRPIFHQQPQDVPCLSDKEPASPLFVTLCSSLIRFWFTEYTGWSNCVPTQTWLRPVTTCVCKPEAAKTVRAPDDERCVARNTLSL